MHPSSTVEHAPVAPGTAPGGPAAAPHTTILVVDDEGAIGRLCRMMLQSLGYQVLLAETPAAALQLAAQPDSHFQLLLTDVRMPGMDGRQLARHLVALRPQLRVLYMSGYSADVFVSRDVAEGEVAFIAKPFTRDALARQVHELLARVPATPPPLPVLV